jgi:hypothetical protein
MTKKKRERKNEVATSVTDDPAALHHYPTVSIESIFIFPRGQRFG